MWVALKTFRKVGADFLDSVVELQSSTTRSLILTIGGIYLIIHFALTINWPGSYGPKMWPITGCFFLIYLGVFHLLSKHLLGAQSLWFLGVTGIVTLASITFQSPEVARLYILLPFLAAVMFGWPVSIFAFFIETALLWFLIAIFHVPLTQNQMIVIMVLSAICGLVGWSSTYALSTVLSWSLYSSDQARKNLRDAREQRARLARTVQDLDKAYHRLQSTNAALVVARNHAEAAERFKSEFVMNVSHELRTPLNLIIGFSEVMTTAPESYGNIPLPGVYRRDMATIYHCAKHLQALVNDVIEMARVEAGKTVLGFEDVSVDTLVAETLEIVGGYIEAKGLNFLIHVEPDLPHLKIDRLRIRQVLLNLLINASRFTDSGSITLCVNSREKEVLFSVQDTGKGIAEEDLPRIFTPFGIQKQSSPSASTGTGLGLPISKTFVELHHGQMGVESSVGKGTTFWFTLPVASGRSGPDLYPASGDKASGQLSERESVVILVHPNPLVLKLIQEHLKAFRVISAENLDEGVKKACQNAAHALIVGQAEKLVDIQAVSPGGFRVIYCPLPTPTQIAFMSCIKEILVKPITREYFIEKLEALEPQPQKILLFGEEPELIRMYQRFTHSHSAQIKILVAYNDDEAVQLIHTEQPDLGIIDLGNQPAAESSLLRFLAESEPFVQIQLMVISTQGEEEFPLVLPGPFCVVQPSSWRLGEMFRWLEAWLQPGSKEAESL